MNPAYNFLNDYLSKVSEDSGKSDPNVDMEDDSDFYDTISEPQPEEDIQYGISQDEPQDENQDVNEPDQDSDDQDPLDYLLGDNDPYSQGNMDDSGESLGIGYLPSSRGKSGESGSLSDRISANESQGKYSAFNSHGGGGGAVGKYQFRWNIWKDSIQKVTGVKSKDEFLQSPEAQEKYFSWYEQHYLKPEANKVQKYNKAGLSMDQLEELVHFRGVGGAKQYLQGKLKDKPESYNMSISKYIAKHQTGGQVIGTKLSPIQQEKFEKWKSKLPENLQYEGDYDLKGLWLENPNVKPSANLHFPDTYKLPNHSTFSNESKYFNDSTKRYAGHWNETDSSYNYVPYDTTFKKPVVERKMQQGGIATNAYSQFMGLNNPSFSNMIFPMEGVNEFRGLDDETPVYLEDETGKKKVLKGRHHKTKMTGKVYEKRLK